MLSFESAEQLLAEPDARRYLHVVILNALRDKATRLEVRFGEDGALLYYRVEDRDWELSPPPDEVCSLLKPTVREAARLVRPERPDVTVLVGMPVRAYEPLEAGWLTYQLGGQWLDLFVRIDPREPFGFIRFDIDGTERRSSPKPRAKPSPPTLHYWPKNEENSPQRTERTRRKHRSNGSNRSVHCFLSASSAFSAVKLIVNMTSDRDERLASLIDRLAADARAGRAADIDSAARDHPDLAAELRELWAVAQFAHLARKPAADKQPTTALPSLGPLTPSFTQRHDHRQRRGRAAPRVRRLRAARRDSAAAGWASSTRRGRRASTASWR